MAVEPTILKVTANRKLDPVLEEALERAKSAPVLLERDGITYRIDRETGPHYTTLNEKNPLFGLIGIGSSSPEPKDVAHDKYAYLADAYAGEQT